MTFRRVSKWLMWGLVSVVVLVCLYLSVFFLPYPMFPHHADLAGFSVYSDRAIPEDFGPILDDARRRIERMEIDRAGGDLRIFVCRSERLFTALNRLAGKRYAGQALVISAAGNAFFSEEGIERVARRNGGRFPHSRLQGSWAAAVAHEAAHAEVYAVMGGRRAREIPVWKAEGHADYSANLLHMTADPDYDLVWRIRWVLDDAMWQRPARPVDRRHFRWQVLVEYLCGVRGLTFDELMEDSLTEESAWADMMDWYSAAEADANPQDSTRTDTP